MAKGWRSLGGSYFYFNTDASKGPLGYMLEEEWLYTDNNYYWFKKNGYMATEWIQYEGKYYYLRNRTEAVKDNKPEGSMAQGWKYLGGSYFYLNTDSSKGSLGYMLEKEWLFYDNSWFYLKEGGYMAINETLTIDGKKYTFNHTGRMI